MTQRVTLRVLVAGGALLGTAAVPLAEAAPAAKPKPVCQIIKDAVGDAGDVWHPAMPASAGDDLVSADLASNATTLTAVIRMAALASPDPEAPLGRNYMISFRDPDFDRQLYLMATTYPQGTSYAFGSYEVGSVSGRSTRRALGHGTGTVDTAKREVRISVPLAAFRAAGASFKAGTSLYSFAVESNRVIGQGLADEDAVTGEGLPIGGARVLFDAATAPGVRYRLGARSCVKVGA